MVLTYSFSFRLDATLRSLIDFFIVSFPADDLFCVVLGCQSILDIFLTLFTYSFWLCGRVSDLVFLSILNNGESLTMLWSILHSWRFLN